MIFFHNGSEYDCKLRLYLRAYQERIMNLAIALRFTGIEFNPYSHSFVILDEVTYWRIGDFDNASCEILDLYFKALEPIRLGSIEKQQFYIDFKSKQKFLYRYVVSLQKSTVIRENRSSPFNWHCMS